jgi:hypothetical protein
LRTQGTGLGGEGVFITNPFAGSTPIVDSKSPFLSLATSNSSGYTSTIYMGRNGTATDQESKIEWSNSTNALSIYVKGQGSYREHVRFGNLSSGTPRTYFGGDVGIGTTAPGNKLDIVSGYNNGVRISGEGTVNNWMDIKILNYVTEAQAASFTDSNHIYTTNPTSGTAFPFTEYGALVIEGRDDASNTGIALRTGNGSGQETRLAILGNGNVGIGTTSPSNKLDVNGIIEADKLILPTAGTTGAGTVTTPAGKLDIRSDSTFSNSAIVARGTTNQNPVLAFYRPTGSAATSYPWWLEANGSTFQIKTGSAANIGSESVSAKVTINSSGSIGVGTTSPVQKVHIDGGSSNSYLHFSNTDTGATSSDGSDIGITGEEDLIVWNREATNLRFATSGTERARISNNGSFGIGTTSPTSQLSNTNINPTDAAGIGNSGTALTWRSGNQGYVGTFDNSNDSTVSNGLLVKTSNTGTASYIAKFESGGVNKMSIRSDGNVGIGTTSPAEKLDLNGTSILRGLVNITTSGEMLRLNDTNSSGNPYMSFYQNGTRRSFIQHADNGDFLKLASEYGGISFFTGTGGTETQKMTILSGGNVGIGTTSPAYLLDVNEDDNVSAFRVTGGGGGAAIASFVRDVGATGSSVNINAQSNFPQIQLVSTGNTFSVGVDSSGNFKISDNTAIGTNDRITIDNTGNVGIGTTSPSFQLELSTDSAGKPTSSAWTIVSDERVKTNIRTYETGLQELLQIKPKVFDYNGKAGFDTEAKNNIGVIAQEIKDIMPETVKKYNAKLNEEDKEDTELYNFDTHALTFALINSVKELNAKIENLEAKIQILKNK